MLKFSPLLIFTIFGLHAIAAQNSAWTGYVTYFNAQDIYSREANLPLCNFVKSGELRIPPAQTNQGLYWTNFELRTPICLTDNFSFEMRFKNNRAMNGFSAYDMAIGLLTSGGATGCTLMGDPIGQRWTNIVVAGQALVTDQPYLVLDMANWTTIKLKFQNNAITYSHDGTPFFTAPYSGNICNLEGLDFRIKGSGSVDWIRVTNDDDKSTVYFEDFLNCNTMSRAVDCTPNINIVANSPCEGDTLRLSTTNRATAYEWTGPNGFQSTKQNPAIPKTDRSSGGTYLLTARLNACQTATQNVNVQVKPLPNVNLGRDTAICNGQVIALNAGNSGNTFRWQDGSTNRNLNVVSSGTYAVTVTNSDGCRSADTVKIDMAATPILPGISVKKPTCYGRCDGEVSANARGGFGAPYSYTWSGGRTTPKVIARCANDINLTITDAKGCILTTVATISQPSKVNAEVEPDNIYNGFAVRCPDSEDGQATVKPSGGAGGFSVVWQTYPLQTTRIATGLRADTTYKVFVFDKNGCSDSATISLTAPPPIDADFTVQNVRCFGEKNGILKLESIKGGISPYSYIFNEKKYTIDSVREYRNLKAGDYIFEIRDTNGCSMKKSLNIQDPPKLKIVSTNDTLIHFGDDVTLFAGVEAPSVLSGVVWKPMRDSLTTGCSDCRITLSSPRVTTVYNLTVKDTFGCVASKDILVRVDKLRRIFVPNTFSPNDDGQNDDFGLFAGKGTRRILNFTVFNRWGIQIYQARNFTPNDESKTWNGLFNGKELSTDTYIWFAEIEFEDGEREVFKGDVALIK